MTQVFFTDIKGDEHKCGHALAAYALKKVFGENANLIAVKDKRPTSNLPNVYLSISHSLNTCAVAVSDSQIGLDIEFSRKPPEKLINIAKRFFSPDEYEYVKNLPDRFYEIWCKKESYVKYTGEGFSRSFSGFSVFELDKEFEAVDINGKIGYICSDIKSCCKAVFVDNADFSKYL